MLDEDAEEEEDDEAVEAAGLASDDEFDEPDAAVDVEDFDDEAGELLDDEPRLSFR